MPADFVGPLIWDNPGTLESATFDTKAEAQRWAAEIEGDMSRARFVDMHEAESTTLEEALGRYSREVTSAKRNGGAVLAFYPCWIGVQNPAALQEWLTPHARYSKMSGATCPVTSVVFRK